MDLIQKIEETYNVSRFGCITRKTTGYALSSSICRLGYVRVWLTVDGKRMTIGLHRLLALKYIPNPDNKPDVNHIDGNKLNNSLDNLEWATRSENIRHSYKLGRKSVEKVERNREILSLYTDGMTHREIAKMYGISQPAVTQIINKYKYV